MCPFLCRSPLSKKISPACEFLFDRPGPPAFGTLRISSAMRVVAEQKNSFRARSQKRPPSPPSLHDQKTISPSRSAGSRRRSSCRTRTWRRRGAPCDERAPARNAAMDDFAHKRGMALKEVQPVHMRLLGCLQLLNGDACESNRVCSVHHDYRACLGVIG